MKILIYGLNYHPELIGIGKYTGEMAEWLARKGHQVRVVTALPYYPEWKISRRYFPFGYRKEVLNGVEIFRCPLWMPGKLNGLTRTLHAFSFVLSSFWMIIQQFLWRPQVVLNIIPTFFSTFVALIGARLFKAKTWLHIQDFEFDVALNLGILRLKKLRKIAEYVERSVLKKFDRVSTISTSMLKNIHRKGIDESATFLFPNWIDTNKIYPLNGCNPIRRELGLNPDTFVALYSGNMGEKQGLDVLVDVARKVEQNQKIKFVFCGEGPAKSKLITLSSGLTNVVFLPLQPNEKLNRLLNLGDVHLLPQKPEVAGLVLPSKLTGILASGKPVILITHPDTEIDCVVKGRGIIAKPDDIDGIANKVFWLSSHPEIRKRLGKAGRAFAVRILNQNKILTQFENQLQHLIIKNGLQG